MIAMTDSDSIVQNELNEELTHEQKMLKIRRRNLRLLEEKEANYGLDVPIQIKNQIIETKEYIKDHEKRIDEIQTTLVEDKQPLSEIEYEMHVTEAWNTNTGHPTVLGISQLAFARMRLHITPTKAKEIEYIVRKKLAKEYIDNSTYRQISYDTLHRFVEQIHSENYDQLTTDTDNGLLNLFIPAIRLDIKTVLKHIILTPIRLHLDYSDRKKMIEYKNRWFTLLFDYIDISEELKVRQVIHYFFEPYQPFNESEWKDTLD